MINNEDPNDDRERLRDARENRARHLRDERVDRYPDDERASRINVVTLFDRLGYDLANGDDINRLNENLRYAERQRRRYERLENNKFGWLISLVLVVAGAVLTALLQWFSTQSTHK